MLTVQAQYAVHIQQQCVRDPADQVLCTEKMDDIIAGFTSVGTYAGAKYRGTPACRDMKANDLCLWGCQRRFTVERDAYGCCYEVTRAYLNALQLTDAAAAFSHQDLVAEECGRPIDDRCALFGGPNATATIDVSFPIPHSFIDRAENKAELEANALADLQRQLGRPDALSLLACDTVLDCMVDVGDDMTTKVTASVVAQDSEALATVTAAYAADVAAGAIVNFATLGYYEARCRGSVMCSWATVARPDVVLTVAVAVLVIAMSIL